MRTGTLPRTRHRPEPGIALRRPERYRDAYRLAFAAGWDAGNQSAHRAGRTAWNEDDRDAATTTMLAILRRWEFDPTGD